MWIAVNLDSLEVHHPTPKQLGGSKGGKVYNHEILVKKRTELVSMASRPVSLRGWVALGRYVKIVLAFNNFKDFWLSGP